MLFAFVYGLEAMAAAIARDSIFPYLKVDDDGYVPGGALKFNRMVSMNDVFSICGLKAERKRAGTARTAPSQRVDDYALRMDDLKEERETPDTALPLFPIDAPSAA